MKYVRILLQARNPPNSESTIILKPNFIIFTVSSYVQV